MLLDTHALVVGLDGGMLMPVLDAEGVLGMRGGEELAHFEVVLVVAGVHAFEPLVPDGLAHDLVANEDEVLFVHGGGEDVRVSGHAHMPL